MPAAEVHLLDTVTFALEEEAPAIAALIADFLAGLPADAWQAAASDRTAASAPSGPLRTTGGDTRAEAASARPQRRYLALMVATPLAAAPERPDPACPFCAIADGTAAARVVHDGPLTVAFFPDHPAVRGHTLVVPKNHVRDFLAADDGTAAAVAGACAQVGRALHAVLAPQGMNAVTSKGRAATQSVFHWHVHLLPRWDGDRLGDLWPPDQPSPAGELDALASSLRHALSS